jgi:hypothetical protein
MKSGKLDSAPKPEMRKSHLQNAPVYSVCIIRVG